jgi:hypothetical protein
MSLERLTTVVLSIPEGVVERRTAVHPICASRLYDMIAWAGLLVRGRMIVSVVHRV